MESRKEPWAGGQVEAGSSLTKLAGLTGGEQPRNRPQADTGRLKCFHVVVYPVRSDP